MLGRSHILINLSVAALMKLPPIPTFALLVGATFPDRFEYWLSLEHRKFGHWWPLYAISLLVSMAAYNHSNSYPYYWMALFCLGCLLHILADFLTPAGIPTLSLSHRHAIAIFKTGSPLECVVTGITFATALYLNGAQWLEVLFP